MDDRAPPDPLRAPPDAKTLPLTMPDQLSRELAEARQKLATLELLARIREHPQIGYLRYCVRTSAECSRECAAENPAGRADHTRHAEAWELLLELLGG
jgi:hypothetical protein